MLLCAAVCLLLTGCGAALGGIGGTPTPTPTAQEIADRVVEAMREVDSLHFAIEFGGAPVYADPDNRFTLISLEGDVRRPDAARAAIQVRSVGSLATIRLVSLAGQMYATNPVTREWICFPEGVLFDPVILFDQQRGLDQLLREQYQNITLEGTTELDGSAHYHLSGTIDGQPLRALTFGMLGVGTVEVDLWADVDTLRLTQMVLVDTGNQPDNPSTWRMTFSDYNSDVDIRAPIECAE
jgi:lipoprotein LprG